MSNSLDPDQVQYNEQPDLAPNFFLILSADDKFGMFVSSFVSSRMVLSVKNLFCLVQNCFVS